MMRAAILIGRADGEHQPLGAGVREEAHLIGDWRPARCAIGAKLRLMQLDQVLGLASNKGCRKAIPPSRARD